MVRALLSKGLDLAETREITGKALSHAEEAITVSFVLPVKERARLEGLLLRIEEQRPHSSATLTNLQRPLLLMALTEVSTRACFPSFRQAVLLFLSSRSTRPRSAP